MLLAFRKLRPHSGEGVPYITPLPGSELHKKITPPRQEAPGRGLKILFLMLWIGKTRAISTLSTQHGNCLSYTRLGIKMEVLHRDVPEHLLHLILQ